MNGAASPTPPTMVVLPSVRPNVRGGTETWLTQASGQKVQVQAVRERCVRADGLVFRRSVTVRIGTRVLVTCGSRGDDPRGTRENKLLRN